MIGRKRIYLPLAILLCVIVIGVIGFKTLGGEDWSLLDSLYMTVITLSTVGYEEVLDLNANPAARTFAIVFIILCLGTIAFAVSSITSFIVEGELKNIMGKKKMEKEISKLIDHYIVCGSDETAQTVIHELILTKKDFVVVEPSLEKIDKLASLGTILFKHGDPTEDDVLLEAGIERAKGILLSLPTDEANLFVAISARSLNPDVRIVAKGLDLKSHKKMRMAGADAVVSPTFIGGMRMVSEMIRPAVVTFLDYMLREREKVLRFEEVTVEEGSSLTGKTVGDTKFCEKTGAVLIAVKKSAGEKYDFNPPQNYGIQAGDTLILIATPDNVEAIEKLAGKS